MSWIFQLPVWCQTVWPQLQFVIRIVRFADLIWTANAPTSQHLALRNMTNIEHRSLFQLLQNMHPRDAGGLGKRRPDCMLRPVCDRVTSQKTAYYRPTTAREHGGYQTVRPTAPCSTPARETSSWSMSAWGVSSCNFSRKPSRNVAKNGHVRQITMHMHGHLTCPEIFWPVSDTRIGTISNPDSISNQSVLALFRTTHLRFCSNFACQFTSMREATVPKFRKIYQLFFELCPSKKYQFDPENRAWPLRLVIILSITPVIIELGTWMIHLWKGLIHSFKLCQEGSKLNLRRQSFPVKDYQSMEWVTKFSRDCPKC